MHLLMPVKLPPGSVKPLTVYTKGRGTHCRDLLKMGPRRRNQLISLVAVTTMTMLLIQYTGYNSLHHEEVRLRYMNPSLPSERTEDEDKFGMAEIFPEQQIIPRGAGRHLQEENRLPSGVVRDRQGTHDDKKSKNRIYQNINNKIDFDRIKEVEIEENNDNSETSLGSQVTIMPAHKIPLSFLKMHYCPGCLGTSLCEDFIAGDVTAFRPVGETVSRVQLPGSWNGKGVILRAPGKNELDSFTQFVCSNSTKTRHSRYGCDISQAIMESILSRTEISISPHEMKQNIFSQDEDPLSIISPSTCAYGNFFAKVKQHFTITSLKSLNNSMKMSSLMSAMLLDPLPVVLKFIENEVPSLLPYFPKYLGACGHVVVIEEEGLPLVNFLPDSWEKRVELALEVFKFIDDIWTMSDEWGFLLLDFSYKNFVVLPDGHLQLISPEKLLVVDKVYFDDILNLEVNDDLFIVKPSCNKICLVTFLNQLIMTNETECSLSINPHQFMYMMASHTLLSDLYTTRSVQFFSEKNTVDENHPGGLLYDLPGALDAKLAQLLYESILESQGGSRLNSVKMIKRLLEVVKKGFLYKRKIEENKKKISVAEPG